MKIEILNPRQFSEISLKKKFFLDSLKNTGYIVRGLFDDNFIDELKSFCLYFSDLTEPSWHPCEDGCPDYHRLHKNYPDAYVKSIQHGYYFHPWNHYSILFDKFKFLFDFKASLASSNLTSEQFLKNIPSTGPIARIVVHQYPKGGGGQEEHVDPVSDFALVQTIIQASAPGIDYSSGGLYINHDLFGKVNFDSLTNKGDLILLSPGFKHGVAPINPEEDLDWGKTNGRWIIMPIIIDSDVFINQSKKPIGLGGYE